MSTHCYIAKENSDGTCKSIYIHFDGYPEGVGEKLLNHYNTPEAVEALLEIGDINSLKNTIEETAKEKMVGYFPAQTCPAERQLLCRAMGDSCIYVYIFRRDCYGYYWDCVKVREHRPLSAVITELQDKKFAE